MQQIAEKAEFAIGTLYKFFNSKEDLYQALILEKHLKFHEALTKAVAEADDEIEKLRKYVQAKGEVFRANVSMIRIYFAETQGARYNVMANSSAEIRHRHRQFMEDLAAIFESGMKKKRFKRIGNPHHLAVALDSISNAFLFLWLEEPERHPYPEDPDTVLSILFKGLLDG